MTVEQQLKKLEKDDGASIADIQGKSSLDLPNSGYRGPVIGECLTCWMNRREVRGAEQSKWVRIVRHKDPSG